MLISHKHKFVYIKTRKTASSSIEGFLETLCAPEGHVSEHWQRFISSPIGVIGGRGEGARLPEDPLGAHSSAADIERYLGEEVFKDYLKIYAVRDPYDKVVSWFWWVLPDDTKEKIGTDFEATKYLFRNWLLMRPNLPADRQFYRTPSGFFPAFPIHYETLGEDLKKLGERLSVDFDTSTLPQWKTQSRGHHGIPLQDYYDDETRAVVEDKFGLDFQQFKYRKWQA